MAKSEAEKIDALEEQLLLLSSRVNKAQAAASRVGIADDLYEAESKLAEAQRFLQSAYHAALAP